MENMLNKILNLTSWCYEIYEKITRIIFYDQFEKKNMKKLEVLSPSYDFVQTSERIDANRVNRII